MKAILVSAGDLSRGGKTYVQIIAEVEVDTARVIDADATALAPQMGTKYKARLCAADFFAGVSFDIPFGNKAEAIVAEPAPIAPTATPST